MSHKSHFQTLCFSDFTSIFHFDFTTQKVQKLICCVAGISVLKALLKMVCIIQYDAIVCERKWNPQIAKRGFLSMHFNSLDSSSTKTRDFQINFLFYLSPPQETFESSRHTILKVQFLSDICPISMQNLLSNWLTPSN